MEILIFICLFIIIFLSVSFFRYKFELEEVLTDLSYDLELLRIQFDDFRFKNDKTKDIKNR